MSGINTGSISKIASNINSIQMENTILGMKMVDAGYKKIMDKVKNKEVTNPDIKKEGTPIITAQDIKKEMYRDEIDR